MHDQSLQLRRVLITLSALSLGWAVLVALTGGVSLQAPWGRLSSRGAIRPLAVAILAGLAYYYRYHQWWPIDARRIASIATPRTIASILSITAFIIGIRCGTFTAGGSDPSGYVSQAVLWLGGDLTLTAPEWVADAPWPNAAMTASPLGYIPGVEPLTQVPTYPPGLPLIMALFHAMGGPDAVYYVVPAFGAALVWSTFRLAATFAGPWGGIMASLLILSSPTFLTWLVMPMTDVPVATCWALALLAALRGTSAGAVLSGAATCAAILIRPNLALLAAVVALIVIVRSGHFRRGLWFALIVSPAIVFVASLNAYLYGSPVRSGYGTVSGIYDISRIVENLRNYTVWMVASQTPLLLLAFLSPLAVRNGRNSRLVISLVCVVFPVLNLGLYLPYLVFDDWGYLRFLLPSYPCLCAGLAVVAVSAVRRYGSSTRIIALTAATCLALSVRGFAYSNTPFDLGTSEPRYQKVATFAGALPGNTVFMSLGHSGSLRHYTGRSILRWDLIEPSDIDRAIEYLARRGYTLHLILDESERVTFQQRFAESQTMVRIEQSRPVVIDTVFVYSLDG